MNVILITSALRPINDHTVFNASERFTQTLNTIKTTNKIPDKYVVIIEGTKITDQEKETFTNLVDYVFCTDVGSLRKSPGEATLLYRYLTSDHFQSLEINTVSKLSGRYWLNDNFNWNSFPNNKTVISFLPISWLNKPLYKTRYYLIPKIHLEHFILGLKRYLNSLEFLKAWPDIEHCFYEHNIIINSEIYSPEILGVCGFITGDNEFVQD